MSFEVHVGDTDPLGAISQNEMVDSQLDFDRKTRMLAVLQRSLKETEQSIASARPAEASRLGGHAENISSRIQILIAELEILAPRIEALAARGAFVNFDEAARRLMRQIRRGSATAARETFDQLSVSPIWLQERLFNIHKVARSSARLDLLFDLFADADPRALSRLYLVAVAAMSGIEAGRQSDAFALLETVRNRCDHAPLRFSPKDMWTTWQHVFKDVMPQIMSLKYHGITFRGENDLFSAAEMLAERLDLDPQLSDFLFPNRADKSLSRGEWERRLRVASCIGHIVSDRGVNAATRKPQRYDGLLDGCEEAFGGLDTSKGVLLTGFHSGTSLINRQLVAKVFKDSVVVTGKKSGPGMLPIIDGGEGMFRDGAGLFRALRLLTDGNTILMMPDGRLGKRNHFGKMLGRSIPTSIGAAFLAYESRCFSAWFNTVPRGGRLVPVVEEAPKPGKGENFESFAERWLRFYWGQLEAFLTGDPSELCIIGKYWATLPMWDS